MQLIYQEIFNLQHINTISKHEQIVHGIIGAIDNGILEVGDKLPSINEMVSEIGYARKTFVKAYTELKERGLVESKKLKGYYIISQETNVTLKVALILFAFHSFQEDFYNTFRKELGKRFHIDIFFHHNNLTLLKTIVDNVSGKYGMYVIAPIQQEEVPKMLQQFAPDKLLVIDRYLKMPKAYSFISQEFEEITYQMLVQLEERIKKYDKFLLFFEENSDFPPEILLAYQRFIRTYQIKGEVVERYDSIILKNQLWQLLKDARKMEYKIGSDIGIITHNDNIIKEIVFGGITTISTDFTLMAKKAAEYVKQGGSIREIIPTSLKERNSL